MKRITFALVITFAMANQPICEVYNLDTDKCEKLLDQNITMNQEWEHFYNYNDVK